MAVEWYYKVMGEEAGPVSPSELKGLAASGFLTPDVLVRKGIEGNWVPSAQVKGLFDDASQAQAANAGWYCQVMGKEIGPLSPSALKELAASGFLSRGVPVRKGVHGDWVPSDRVKGLFAAALPPPKPRPSGICWYCKAMGEETGPLSSSQLKELAQSGFIAPDVLVRKGADGAWIPAGRVKGLFDQAGKTADAKSARGPSAPTAQIPKPPPPPTAKTPPAEGMRDRADKPSAKPALPRAQAADTRWYYEAMGQQTGPLSASQLKELAGSGLLAPDTLVRKGTDGHWLPARRVRGLFDEHSVS